GSRVTTVPISYFLIKFIQQRRKNWKIETINPGQTVSMKTFQLLDSQQPCWMYLVLTNVWYIFAKIPKKQCMDLEMSM
ncbi:MAG: hypothetical protein PHU23_11535, partial [Dehalococcoidales bacterium]|nr:hypothetical protein [Dehalococcoidales bacterium]